MRIITLEEHFATPGFLDGPGQDLKNAALKFEGRATRLIEGLTDIADKRIAAMDAAGIDMQVLSLTSPGTEQLDAADAIALAREVNDFLAAGGEEESEALRRLRRAADRGAGQGRRRARKPHEVRRLRRRRHQRP